MPIIKFMDDTTLQGLFLSDNELLYRQEVYKFVSWCYDNFLCLNVDKTKELHVDFKKHKKNKMSLHIKGEVVQQVSKYKYLGVTIDEKLQRSDYVKITKTKGNKRIYFLRKLTILYVNKTLIYSFFINQLFRVYYLFVHNSLGRGVVAWKIKRA